MKTQRIAALLVAVSASVAAPVFASESTVTRAQVRAELAALQQAVSPRLQLPPPLKLARCNQAQAHLDSNPSP